VIGNKSKCLRDARDAEICIFFTSWYIVNKLCELWTLKIQTFLPATGRCMLIKLALTAIRNKSRYKSYAQLKCVMHGTTEKWRTGHSESLQVNASNTAVNCEFQTFIPFYQQQGDLFWLLLCHWQQLGITVGTKVMHSWVAWCTGQQKSEAGDITNFYV